MTRPAGPVLIPTPASQTYRQALPAPLATTRGRGWACAPIDIYAVGNAVFTTPQRENLVCVQLCGESRIRAEVNGGCREHHATPGHVMVAPA